MNACLKTQPRRRQLLLLGVGGVGRAFLQRWARQPADALELLGAANSQHAWSAARVWAQDASPHSADCDADSLLAELRPGDVLVDASASDALAARHPQWLAQGLHVVTANKLGAGGPLARWQAIEAAQRHARVYYGNAATVGAGLPMLRSLRELQDGGDRIQGLAGLLSGTLGWLLDGFDGRTAFSLRVQRAVAQGYAEPDPRADLSGEDVRRKLLILARACGAALSASAVNLQPLLALDARLDADTWAALDADLARRARAAIDSQQVLRVVARWDAQGANIGLEALPAHDPLAGSRGCENRLLIRSDRYHQQPLLIGGPGAGVDVTAAALIDDALRACRSDAA